MRPGSWAAVVLSAAAAAAVATQPTATTTLAKRADPSFVSVQNGEFRLDGKPFFNFATTAYWLTSLSDDDITTTLTAIAKAGIKVVRTWAFKDVTSVPTDNTTVYFQVLENGTQTINTGPNGLQRLDRVIGIAESLGLKVQLTLTNNWNALRDPDTSDTVQLPLGFLSNDYGGMDAYVRNFVGATGTHDQFFRNDSLIEKFTNYLNVVVARYATNTSVFSWEIANDPRCNSTLPSASDCQSTDVTTWVSTISKTVKKLDPNHIVASGAGGFMCVGCTKLFATQAAAPSPSANPQGRRRSTGLLTPAKMLAKRAELQKKWRKERSIQPGDRTIRGRWAPPATKRQSTSSNQGTAFNGATGVDSEDISAIPEIDVHTFQLFPDQNSYNAADPAGTDPVTAAIDAGTQWISTNADAAASNGKPAALTAFGLVPLNASSHFVPFNASSVTVADVISGAVMTIGANSTQQADAYSSWIQAALMHKVSSIGQYQWGQSFTGSTTPLITQSPLSSPNNVSQLSPDDGYGDYSDSQKAVFSMAAQQQSAMNNGP